MNTIKDYKKLINQGYEVVEYFVTKTVGVILLSYLQTPYAIDNPEDKELTLSINDYHEIVNADGFETCWH